MFAAQQSKGSQTANPDLVRLAIVSTSVPPSATGQATVLKRLFQTYTTEDCLFITDDQGTDHPRTGELTFAQYYNLPAAELRPPIEPFKKAALVHFKEVLKRSRLIEQQLAVFRPDAVIACTGSPVDLPATWLACWKLNLPFLVHLFDDPVFQWGKGRLGTMASIFEALWSTRVAGVIGPNEQVLEDLKKRRPFINARFILIRNPVEPLCFGKPNCELATDRPLRIVYTGSIYSAQGDALKNLSTCLENLDGAFQLHLYSPQPEAVLDGLGIKGPNVFFHGYVEGKSIYEVQQNADILFLPLAFNSNIQNALRTAAPGKTGEYLASGKPVLVHAPEYTFLSRFFRAHNAGVVVDEFSTERLAEALQTLRTSRTIRNDITQAAQALALEFNADVARTRLLSELSKITGRQRAKRIGN